MQIKEAKIGGGELTKQTRGEILRDHKDKLVWCFMLNMRIIRQ